MGFLSVVTRKGSLVRCEDAAGQKAITSCPSNKRKAKQAIITHPPSLETFSLYTHKMGPSILIYNGALDSYSRERDKLELSLAGNFG